MNDEQWKEYIKTINDPVEMLKVIVENNDYLGFDRYYADLRTTMLEQAAKIAEESQRKCQKQS